MKTPLVWMILLTLTCPALARAERFNAADSEGVTATREDNMLILRIAEDVKGPIRIPRLAAPLRSINWESEEPAPDLTLKPEPDTWLIGWKNKPEGATTLVLAFDGKPQLLSEVELIQRSADGSFYLPAHLAMTKGEKIRYEPQPHKNTVGYWTGKDDTAMWSVQIDQPGRFNVAVLQGCGKGQGGSQAMMMFMRSGETEEDAKLDFTVVETGHFQNFQWFHLGEVELPNAAVLRVGVGPQQIKKAALMDIRAIHLTRVPDAKAK